MEQGKMDEAEHLAELAEQCRDEAAKIPPSFSRTRYLRRAEFLEQAAQEKADAAMGKSGRRRTRAASRAT
jgi:hypothetical protein